MAAVLSSPYCKWHLAKLRYDHDQSGFYDPTEHSGGFRTVTTDNWKTTTLVKYAGRYPDPGPAPGPPPPGGCSSGSLADRLFPGVIFGGAVASFAAPLLAGSGAAGASSAVGTTEAASTSPFSGTFAGISSTLKSGGLIVSKIGAAAGLAAKAKSLISKATKPPANHANQMRVSSVDTSGSPQAMAASIPYVVLFLGVGALGLYLLLRSK